MAELTIKSYSNPVLRKKSEEIKEITPEIKRLALDMVETMVKNKGLGLAAPQVGISKRIVAVLLAEGPKIFINPKITKKEKETEIAEEGCLCFPNLFLDIKRAKSVAIKAIDVEGKEMEFFVDGLTARIFQHEIDHLNGILFFDKISFWQRLKLRKKLKNP